MLIKTLCLGSSAGAINALAALAQGVAGVADGPRQVDLFRVLRHIPSDSVNQQKGQGVVPVADDIDTVIELRFDDPAKASQEAAREGVASFVNRVNAIGRVLFALDTITNIPIEPRAGALQGGFRRWMLLARKARTQGEFRDAWFGRHALLVKDLPHVDGYLQNLVTARYDAAMQPVDYPTLPIDGIAQLCFADEAAMNASYGSPARIPLRDDGRDLLGRITTLLVDGRTYT